MIKVTYIDHMGSDLSVVNAARVSFGKTSEMDMSDQWGPPKLMKPLGYTTQSLRKPMKS